jgi:hypothetical protein
MFEKSWQAIFVYINVRDVGTRQTISGLGGRMVKGSNFELFTKVWAHKTSLAPPLFIEAPVPSQEVSGHDPNS